MATDGVLRMAAERAALIEASKTLCLRCMVPFGRYGCDHSAAETGAGVSAPGSSKAGLQTKTPGAREPRVDPAPSVRRPTRSDPSTKGTRMTIQRVCTTDGALIESYLGKPVFVRTVTHHYTGLLEAADDSFLLLADAAWIADDGRFADALATGALDEVEPFPGACLVSRGALLDVCAWDHELPRTQK